MHHLYHCYPLTTGLYDVRGVWPIGKLCEFAGTFFARRKRWAFLGASGFGALDLGVNMSTGTLGQSWQTLGAMAGIIGIYLAAAYGLKYGPMLLQGRKRGTAEAANVNLMEDYRQSRADIYLKGLWDQVFCYEPFGDYADLYQRRRDECGRALEGPTGLERLGKTRNEDQRRALFFELAHTMLETAQPQSEQERHLGTGFEMLEDLFDAGPWTQSDRKLEQNYDTHPRLQEARALAGYGWVDFGHETVKRLGADLWFRFLRSSVAAHVGEILQTLNEQYDNTVNAQRLLWPGDERTPLAGLDLATSRIGQADIRKAQRHIMQKRLGATHPVAQRKLNRMLTPVFQLATTLRARFDPAYVTGELGHIMDDLRGNPRRSNVKTPLTNARASQAAEKQREAAAALSQFDAWLESTDLFIATTEQVRAARTAFHVNFDGMQDAFFASQAAGQSPLDRRTFRQPFYEVLGRPHPWTYMLIDVRMLHVLARLRRDEYEDAVCRLGGYDESDAAADESVAEQPAPASVGTASN